MRGGLIIQRDDLLIENLFRLFFLGLVVLTVLCLRNYPIEIWGVYIASGFVFCVSLAFIFRYFIFKKIYNNGLKLSHRVPCATKKGNFFMAVPHTFKFQDKKRTCYVTGSVTSLLDYELEYTYPTEKEIECRIFRRGKLFHTKRAVDEETFSKFYRVIDEDKEMCKLLIRDDKTFGAILRIVENFDQILFGRDNTCRLITRYNSFLTEPGQILSTFDDLKILDDFLETNWMNK